MPHPPEKKEKKRKFAWVLSARGSNRNVVCHLWSMPDDLWLTKIRGKSLMVRQYGTKQSNKENKKKIPVQQFFCFNLNCLKQYDQVVYILKRTLSSLWRNVQFLCLSSLSSYHWQDENKSYGSFSKWICKVADVKCHPYSCHARLVIILTFGNIRWDLGDLS